MPDFRRHRPASGSAATKWTRTGTGLIVEVDGYVFYSGRAAFERDRRRGQDLQSAGLRVLRVTWRQLTVEPEALAARLGSALAVVPGRSGLPEA